MNTKILLRFLICSILVIFVNSLTLDEIQEGKCGRGGTESFITPNYNLDWAKSKGYDNENTTFYFPLVNQVDYFRLTQSLYRSNEFESFADVQMINSCITIQKSSSGLSLRMDGYDGRSFVKNLQPIRPKLFRFDKSYENGLGGYASVALSVNKSYDLFDICHDDGLRSFAVVSPYKTLNTTTMETIKEFVKALGFSEKHFVYPNYKNCPHNHKYSDIGIGTGTARTENTDSLFSFPIPKTKTSNIIEKFVQKKESIRNPNIPLRRILVPVRVRPNYYLYYPVQYFPYLF